MSVCVGNGFLIEVSRSSAAGGMTLGILFLSFASHASFIAQNSYPTPQTLLCDYFHSEGHLIQGSLCKVDIERSMFRLAPTHN